MAIKEQWQKNVSFLFDFRYKNDDGTVIKRTFFEKLSWIFTVWITQILYVSAVMGLLKAAFGGQSIWTQPFLIWEKLANVFLRVSFYESLQMAVVGSLVASIFFACILAPWWETYAFQSHWLDKILRKREKEELTFSKEALKKLGRLPIKGTAFFTSIIFGVVHGGPINILIQGVGGMFLCFVYLRTGRSFWSVVATHSLYNATWIFFAYTGAWKSALSAFMF